MELFFSIIAISGILGGLIFALDSSHTHSLSIPWDGQEISTGCFGHIIVGVGGSIIAIGASVPIFKLDLTVFTNTTDGFIVPLELILYLFAFGVLGGYSGLRIISGMSDAMMKKLEKELQTQKKETNETTKELRELRELLAKNVKDDLALKLDVEKYKDNHDLMKGAFLTKTGKSDDAIDILIKQTKKHHDCHKRWTWLGSAYKNIKQYDEALKCSIKASNLAPEVWSYHFNCACYSSLDKQNKEIIIKYLKEAVDKYKQNKTYSDMEVITKVFNDDHDLDLIKKQVDILTLLN